MKLQDGETIGDYLSRLERRVAELEPPEGFTVQEWCVGQVYAYILWIPDDVRRVGAGASQAQDKWLNEVEVFEKRFPEQTKKFADYMGWNREQHKAK